MTTRKPIHVFISYSHDLAYWGAGGGDSETQRRRVFTLSEALRKSGVDTVLDQHITNPVEGWPRWMNNQVQQADFVLVVCTQTYNRRFEGAEQNERGSGVQWEGAIITQELYESNGKNRKFIPIVFGDEDRRHVPAVLRAWTSFDVSVQSQYDELYYLVTNQPPFKSPVSPTLRKRVLPDP